MIVEVSPEPSRAEREAIEAALWAVFERDGYRRGDWWKAGLRENLAAGGGLDPTPEDS